jgi:UDP-N-acetylglucosamine 2-epimerase (non-hydrolysing)
MVKKIVVVFGTRPEAIKMAPVIGEMLKAKYRRRLEVTICCTAQHREMVDQVLSVFGIEPDIDLNLMRENQGLADFAANALTAVTDVLQREKPNLVLVQGDTTTAMVGGLAAFYQHTPVGHVEAGLRTNDRYRPFPEEINRRVISVLSTWNFAPTKRAAEALIKEGLEEKSVHITGNTVIDAVQEIAKRRPGAKYIELAQRYRLPSNGGRLILVTAHRRESFGEPFRNICEALAKLVDRNPDVKIIYPVHYNPNVKEVVHGLLGSRERIHLIEPVDYETFVHLMKSAYLILTDSGGIQEEAPALGKPVLVLRDVTERPEAIEAGTAKIVGTRVDSIVSEAEKLLLDSGEYVKMAFAVSPFGDGHAARRIVDILLGCEGSKRKAY